MWVSPFGAIIAMCLGTRAAVITIKQDRKQ
jgi:hypothetical protein